MIRITRFLYIHILLAPMLVLSFVLKSQTTFFICFGVVLIHELSHLFAALFVKVRVKSIVILPFGMTLRLDESVIRHPEKEIAIAAAGPVSNVIMLFISGVILKTEGGNLNLLIFTVANWSVLLLNLIPVPPLDGGRILRCVFIKNVGLIPASKKMYKISRFFVGVVCVLGVVALVISKSNPSLCIIGAFLIFSLVEEKRNADLLIASELIREKEKFRDKKLIASSVITIRENAPAASVIKKLNLSTFYVIYVVDENMKITKTATESDFIRAVKKCGYSVCAKDV